MRIFTTDVLATLQHFWLGLRVLKTGMSTYFVFCNNKPSYQASCVPGPGQSELVPICRFCCRAIKLPAYRMIVFSFFISRWPQENSVGIFYSVYVSVRSFLWNRFGINVLILHWECVFGLGNFVWCWCNFGFVIFCGVIHEYISPNKSY